MTSIRVNSRDYKRVLERELHTREHYLSRREVKVTSNVVEHGGDVMVLFNDIKEQPPFRQYQVIAYGIMPCGSKCTVVIKGIKPFVDIECDPELSKESNVERLKCLLKHERLRKALGAFPRVDKLELVYGKKLIGFAEDDSTFIRLRFSYMKDRNALIKFLAGEGIDTFNNDLGSYYRVVARQFKISLAGWNKLSHYTARRTNEYRCRFTFEVNVDDITQHSESMDVAPWTMDSIRVDKAISMCWDIEQYSADFDVNNPNRPTRLPRGDVMDDTIFNIGMTFQFINEPDAFLRLSLISKEAKPHDDYITVICEDEKTLLLTWAFINSIIQPDFMIDFNGSQYDWDNVVHKGMMHEVLPQMADMLSMRRLTDYEMDQEKLERFSFRHDTVKISADQSSKGANMQMHGYVPIDLRTVLRCANQTESKSSLKFYLDMYGLPNKDDMPIPMLFTYFHNNDVDKLGDVAHYCYIDCFRLHQLMFKLNVIQDKRAVGLLSFTSVFDAFYRANGSKVRNLALSVAYDMNLFGNTILKEVDEQHVEKGKYPGALVLKPRRGLVAPTLTFKEFCEHRLQVVDPDVIAKGQRVLVQHYDAFFNNFEINSVDDVNAIMRSMGA